MVKIIGPFHSDDASGTFADTLTASKWKGRNYIRQRVIPSNPQTTDQKAVRSILGTIAKSCKAVLTSYADTLGMGSEFFQDARDGAPSGQSWISWLQKVLNSLFDSLVTDYGSVTATIQGYYNTEAGLRGLNSYTDKSGVTHTAGEQLYLLASFAVTNLGYTGFASGINTASEVEVQAFGDYVCDSK